MPIFLSQTSGRPPSVLRRTETSDILIGAYALGAGKPLWRSCRVPSILVALLLAMLLIGCRKTPPEEAIRAAIGQMQTAAESRDVGAILEPIAEDFAGPGGMDRKAFRQYVALVSLRNEKVGVDLGPMEVKLFGDRATATFTAAARGGSAGGLLPDQAQVYRVDTAWRLDEGEWKLISATWEPVL
jgi:ketosteroid isomerase-like protein